jgi:YegS/Rv2252/BmrU family lipid kinase
MKMQTHIILNPVAGGGKAKKMRNQILAIVEKRFGKDYLLRETIRQGDAIFFAREIAEDGAAVIIAAGGDGTISEVVNGMMTAGNSHTAGIDLGIVDLGSGSGLSQTLGLPGSVSDQLDMILNSDAKAIDVGFVDFNDKDKMPCRRYFISECQVGIGGAVVSGVGKKLKCFGGRIAFGSVALSSILNYKASEISLRCDNRQNETKKMIGVTVGNGIYCAGGMRLTPFAQINDGMLDVLCIYEMNLLERIYNFGKVYSGKHIYSEHFSINQAKEITLDSDHPIWLEADGELLGMTPCRIGIMPKAIRVRCKEQ